MEKIAAVDIPPKIMGIARAVRAEPVGSFAVIGATST